MPFKGDGWNQALKSLIEAAVNYAQAAKKMPKNISASFNLEAPPRLELGVKVLQTSALPLGYGAI